MLKITEADGLTTVRTNGTTPVIDLTDTTGLSDGSTPADRAVGPVLSPPKESIAWRDRRAVGRVVRCIGHLLDAAAAGVVVMVIVVLMDGVFSWSVVALFVIVATVLLWPTHQHGRHLISPSEGLASLAGRVAGAPVATWTLLVAVMYVEEKIFPGGELAPRSLDLVATTKIVVFTLPLVLLGRVISYRIWTQARVRGYDLEDTLIVGSGPIGVEIADALAEDPHAGLVPCGFVDRFEASGSDLPLVGHPEDLPAIVMATGVRRVVIAFGGASERELVDIVRRCRGLGVEFLAVPRLFELGVSAGNLGSEVDGLPLIKVMTPDQRAVRAKRMFDIAVAAALLVITAPILIACALAVKFTSRGPVFFRQVRCGIGGQPFEILKFRSMTVNNDSSTQWCVDGDDRVTAVGRIIRPSHLDELPQLLNVLRGDMSLVGPRPERPHFVEQFSAEVDNYDHRHRVPVGITGWAQVNGYWGDSSIERRVRLDNRYIENWSIWRDLVITMRTIPTLFGKRR